MRFEALGTATRRGAVSSEVPNAGSGAPAEYDLRGVREGRRNILPYFRIGLLVGGLIDLGVLVYSVYSVVAEGQAGRLLQFHDLFILGGGAVFFTLLAMIFLVTRPSAERCSWDREGFTFHYPNGQSLRYPWASPKFRLRLQERTDIRGVLYGTTSAGILPPNHLSSDLYLAILREANSRGMGLTTRTFKGFGSKTVSTEIRPGH